MPWWGILLIVIGVIIVAFFVFSMIFGSKIQKRQAEAEKQMEAAKQTVSILVIAKAKKKFKEAGLPEAVMASAPWYSKIMKVPVVRAKVGPKVMNLLADASVFEVLPVNRMCTVTVSGIYITEIKAVRGQSVPKINRKKTWREKLLEKSNELRKK